MRLRPFSFVLSLPFALALALADSAVDAAIVLQTGFEQNDTPPYTLGALPSTTSLPVFFVSGTVPQVVNTPSVFGSSNQFLSLGQVNTRVRSSGLTPLTTISFDLFEPSGTTGTTRFGFGVNDINSAEGYTSWIVNNGVFTLGSNTSLASGSLPTLLQDRHYIAKILLNRSGVLQSVALDGGGSLLLPNSQAALFFYDTVTGAYIDGGTYSHTASVNPGNFLFRSFSGDGNLIYVDNFTRLNTLVVIPEPSVPLLGSLGLFALIARRGRRSARPARR
jgi:hypothetical protein